MASKTKESGRADILVRMSPELKARVIEAATENGITNTDWILDVIEEALAKRDAEVAAKKHRADLERRLEMKFQEVASVLAANTKLGDRTKLSSQKRIELEEATESAIQAWRDRTAVDHYARPRTVLEQLSSDYLDLEAEILNRVPEDRTNYFEIQIDDDVDFDGDDAGT